ncbi:glutamate ABC transporter substrate-binding protein [Amycolatopsis suaedae]|uniref:Glutamate ABC transporter substrate-binding protein n=1 Tax=Amycolatopsis suaedae TaxID=2510978 RepID=A0A4Q7J3Y0_9PSEU|nr:glutamate ABC transporter substrate-binding protein [Amycolatopsis suaedae]RZQ62241.1 glutamate ABC transporter substrate-binding protein [Amycolatopsis suaedae]
MRVIHVITGVILLAVAACSPSADPESVVGRARDSGTLVIGTRFDQPGISQRTLDGRLVGFDVDVATYVAGELGVDADDITWREIPTVRRETDLAERVVDLVVATYSITDARKQQVTFAGPYFDTGQDLLVRTTSPDITGPETLAGRKLCAVPNTTSAQMVKDRFAQTAELVEYPRYPDCVTALLAGQVDAVSTDGVILAGFAADHPELLRVVGKPFAGERYGVGLRKGDTDGQRAVNDAIRKMISSGAWHDSLQRNIGPSGYQLPPPPAVTEQ